jgi:hypothetical protein
MPLARVSRLPNRRSLVGRSRRRPWPRVRSKPACISACVVPTWTESTSRRVQNLWQRIVVGHLPASFDQTAPALLRWSVEPSATNGACRACGAGHRPSERLAGARRSRAEGGRILGPQSASARAWRARAASPTPRVESLQQSRSCVSIVRPTATPPRAGCGRRRKAGRRRRPALAHCSGARSSPSRLSGDVPLSPSWTASAWLLAPGHTSCHSPAIFSSRRFSPQMSHGLRFLMGGRSRKLTVASHGAAAARAPALARSSARV